MVDNFILKDFKKAVKKLEEILSVKKTEIVRDSAIKRFEICFDLAWKFAKNIAKQQGEIECYSPKQCFKAIFQLRIIKHDGKWIKMVDDRNACAHIYKESMAEKIYPKLNGYLELFQELLKTVTD